MDRHEKGALALTAEIFELGMPGTISPAALIVAEDHVLVALLRVVPDADPAHVMSYLTGGRMTVGGYCSIWEDRPDLLAGLERIQRMMPDLFHANVPNEFVVDVARSRMDRLVELAEVNSDFALLLAPVFDPATLRADLELLGGILETPLEVLLQTGSLPQDDQAALVGLFLSDMEGTSAHHVLGLSFVSPVWRLLFVTLSGPEHVDSAIATVETVNSLTLSAA